jgi:hypothetical protein
MQKITIFMVKREKRDPNNFNLKKMVHKMQIHNINFEFILEFLIYVVLSKLNFFFTRLYF